MAGMGRARAGHALVGAGISRLEQLAEDRETEIKSLHGMGPDALSQLRHVMSAKGLTFASEESP